MVTAFWPVAASHTPSGNTPSSAALFYLLDLWDWPLRTVDVAKLVDDMHRGLEGPGEVFSLTFDVDERPPWTLGFDAAAVVDLLDSAEESATSLRHLHFVSMSTHSVGSEVILGLKDAALHASCDFYGPDGFRPLALGCAYRRLPPETEEMMLAFTADPVHSGNRSHLWDVISRITEFQA